MEDNRRNRKTADMYKKIEVSGMYGLSKESRLTESSVNSPYMDKGYRLRYTNKKEVHWTSFL